jgi:excisionase family DNA binding protein
MKKRDPESVICNKPFLNISEAARFLGVSHVTVRKWVMDGLIEHLKIDSTRKISTRAKITYLIPRHAIDKFIEAHTVQVGETAKLPESPRKKKMEMTHKPLLRI